VDGPLEQPRINDADRKRNPEPPASPKPRQVVPRVEPRCRKNTPDVSRNAAKIAVGAGRIRTAEKREDLPIGQSPV
jgi:hypothetical protein